MLALETHHNKMKLIDKGTAGTQYLVDKFGYDTKQALHAIRVLDFLVRFHARDFADFKGAITYDGYCRDDMLKIKTGAFTLCEMKRIAAETLLDAKSLERDYLSQRTDEQTRDEVNMLIMELVKDELLLDSRG